jgi:single-strand DNA-binding protein
MGFDNTVTVVGNVTRDPELRFTQGGLAVANFGLAWNKRRKDGEEETSFFDVACFQQLAENVAESITKGARVVIYGTLQQRSWENQEGERRSKVEIVADDVAPSLRWATAQVTRNEYKGGGAGGGGGGGGGGDAGGASQGGGDQPAANQPPAYDMDEEPF